MNNIFIYVSMTYRLGSVCFVSLSYLKDGMGGQYYCAVNSIGNSPNWLFSWQAVASSL